MIKLLPNSTILPIKPFQGPYSRDFYLECTYKKPSNTLKKSTNLPRTWTTVHPSEFFLFQMRLEHWRKSPKDRKQNILEGCSILWSFLEMSGFEPGAIKTKIMLLTASWRDTSSSTWSPAQPARPRKACHCPARGAPGLPGRSVCTPSCCCINIVI